MLHIALLRTKEYMVDKLITIALVISAIFTAWAVLTPNHLYVG